jgi:N-acetylglucosamine kinase-like BadF-type ATPase
MGMGPQTVLTERLLAAANCSDVPVFLEGLMRDRIEIGGEFAPQVAQAANEGDKAAQEIFRRAGRTVGENGVSIARRLGMLDTEFVLVTAGGVFSSRNVYLNESLLATLQAAAPRVRLVHWDAPPVIGAVLLALDQLRLPHLPDTAPLAGQVTAALAT